MHRISIKLAATALGLSLFAAPAFAVDYLVGVPYCTPEAVNFIEERDGDRYHWCLAPKPTFEQSAAEAFARAASSGTSSGPAVMPGKPDPKPADPDPVDPDPETPPASIPATPLFPATPIPQPDPDPGECQKVSDCPNEPDEGDNDAGDGDHDNGHSNDDDGHDEGNPGNGGGNGNGNGNGNGGNPCGGNCGNGNGNGGGNGTGNEGGGKGPGKGHGGGRR